MGAVGSARKRTLMLWQAVELSRAGEAPDAATLDIARCALEPPPDAQVTFRIFQIFKIFNLIIFTFMVDAWLFRKIPVHVSCDVSPDPN